MLAKMMGSPYHPYSDTIFTINQKGADDIDEEGRSKMNVVIEREGSKTIATTHD